MKLKELDNYLAFMEAVNHCAGEVYFDSYEGDHLNLKSTFCQLLFASACGDREYMKMGEIICQNEADYRKLDAYLYEAKARDEE